MQNASGQRHRGGAVFSVVLHQTGRVVGGCASFIWLVLARHHAGVGADRGAGGPRGGLDRRSRRLHPWLVPVLRLRRVAVPGLGRRERPASWQLSDFKPFALAVWLVAWQPGCCWCGSVIGSACSGHGLASGSRRQPIARGRMDRHLHNGGYDDVLMPAYAAVALLVGGSVALLRRHALVAVRVAASVVLAGLLAVNSATSAIASIGRSRPRRTPPRRTPDRADPPSSGSGTRLRPPVLRRDSGQGQLATRRRRMTSSVRVQPKRGTCCSRACTVHSSPRASAP